MSKSGIPSSMQATTRILLVCIVLLVLGFAIGCGGHSNAAPGPPTPSPTPGVTSAQVRIGDAPANSVIGFEVTFGNPLTVTLSTGQSANITLQNNRLELSHMAAKMEPLSVVGFPQGSISSIQLTLTDPEVTYLDAAGKPHTFAGNPVQPVTFNPNPPLVIGSSPTVVNVDINVAGTLTFDPSGTVTAITFSGSSFTFTTKAIAAEAEQQDDSGEMEGVTGKVTVVNGNNFEVAAGQGGASITFVTDATTQFDKVTLATLLNQIVKVEGFTKPDGTVFAREVEGLESQSGSELEGLISAIPAPSPAPASSLVLLLQDGTGNGMDPAKMGQSFTVNLTGLSKYAVDQGRCDMGGSASSLLFDATHISAGQRIEVELNDGVPPPNGSTSVPDQIKFEQQALTGIVAAGSMVQKGGGAAEFDLNLPGDSYLTLLSGATLVHVFLQPVTDKKVTTIAEGSTIRVRGLLFFTPNAPAAGSPATSIVPTGFFNMVARRVTAP